MKDVILNKKINAMLLGAFLSFFLTACDTSETGDSSDTTPPSKIVLTDLTSSPDSISFTWTDPEEPDFDHVNITCMRGPVTVGTITVSSGIETHTQGSLNPETSYTFSIVSVDKNGNKSEAFTFSESTQPDTTGPSTIVLTGITTGPDSIGFTWTDPEEPDFDHVNITCSHGTTTQGPVTVSSGIETHTQNSLSAETFYTFNVTSEDETGNLSEAHTFTILTLASASDTIECLMIYSADDLNAVRGGIAGYDNWGLNKNYILMTDIDLKETEYSSNWTPLGNSSAMFYGTFLGNGHVISNLTITNYRWGLFYAVGSGGSIQNLGLENVDITGTSNTGGMVGQNNGSIFNCYITGIIVSGMGDNVGGLAGRNYGEITNCYSACSVSGYEFGPDGAEGVGGLVGYNSEGSISNCYATGEVTGFLSVGGLVGYNDRGNISASYATGNVTGNGYLGGLLGENYLGTISDCFYDSETTGRTDTGKGTGKTTLQMKDVATFTDTSTDGLDIPWDFVDDPNDDTGSDDIWSISSGINDGYPHLTGLDYSYE